MALIIRFALLLIFAGISLFFLAIGLNQLAFSQLAEQTSQFGSLVLLCAFALPLLISLIQLAKMMLTAFFDYFSSHRRIERKLLFYANQHNRIKRLFHLKKIRMLYVNQQKRKHLLRQNNRKSVTL
jgi:hypothetical protein